MFTTDICVNGHESSGASTSQCPFAPCSQRFLSPQEKAARTRRAKHFIAPERTNISADDAFDQGLVEWQDDNLVWVGAR